MTSGQQTNSLPLRRFLTNVGQFLDSLSFDNAETAGVQGYLRSIEGECYY